VVERDREWDRKNATPARRQLDTDQGPHDPASTPDLRFKLLNWIAIIDQLATTRANRLLDAGDLPFPQFLILLHFSLRPGESLTVGQVAAAFQQPQPGVTKTIQKLEQKHFLVSEPHPTDGRAKLFKITKSGLDELSLARRHLAPVLAWLFDEWTPAEMSKLFQALDRLKIKLDTSRAKPD
jgi:DNA-binding MarR family transcriptional regulator